MIVDAENPGIDFLCRAEQSEIISSVQIKRTCAAETRGLTLRDTSKNVHFLPVILLQWLYLCESLSDIGGWDFTCCILGE